MQTKVYEMSFIHAAISSTPVGCAALSSPAHSSERVHCPAFSDVLAIGLATTVGSVDMDNCTVA